MMERMQTWQTITKVFYCQKVGHVIKDWRAKIIVEVDVKQQSNVATSSKKLYVVTIGATPYVTQFAILCDIKKCDHG
jgi:hypothetical protein